MLKTSNKQRERERERGKNENIEAKNEQRNQEQREREKKQTKQINVCVYDDEKFSSLSSLFLADGGVRKSTRPFSRMTFKAACSAARTTSSL